ncbi:MAG: signal peptidase II [Paracoccaceae bacterium]|uniref:signal peptidase II n=1 Tax=Celeribacter marinus TaxID=1397108 RepID=UPI0031770145
MARRFSFGVLGTVVAVGLDQFSKLLVVNNASALSAGYSVLPGFDLVYHRNSGISFGMLSGAPSWALIFLAVCVCLWLIALIARTKERLEAVALGLILGGGLGNAIDRLRVGAVTDFLDIYIGELHWPAFNLADAAIFCGGALLIARPFSRHSRNK